MPCSPDRTIGIYSIVGPTGRLYIGKSIRIRIRFSEHRVKLRRGHHRCGDLQRDWIKHGEDAFKFEVLETCAPSRLTNREQHYLDLFASSLYNQVRQSYETPGKLTPGSLAKTITLRDGTTFNSIGEFARFLGYPNYTGPSRHLSAGKSPDGIVALRRKGVKRFSLDVELASGERFPTIQAFAKACGYVRSSSVYWHLSKGRTFDEIAKLCGLVA